MSTKILDEDALLSDCIKGLIHYGLPEARAEVLAKTNLMFIAEEMYESLDAALIDIASKEKKRKKGYINDEG